MNRVSKLSILLLAVIAAACPMPFDRPGEERIKADLIGKQTPPEGLFGFYWRFDSIQEFEKFEIIASHGNGEALEYEVDVILRGGSSTARYKTTLLITYVRQNGNWALTHVINSKTLERLPSEDDTSIGSANSRSKPVTNAASNARNTSNTANTATNAAANMPLIYARTIVDEGSIKSTRDGGNEIIKLSRGERLLLLHPTDCKTCHQSGWYKVRHLNSKNEGWIDGNDIKFE